MIKPVVAALSITLLSMTSTGGAVELSSSEQAALKTKINLAGRQRTLSQKMAKAACMAFVQPGNKEHFKELSKGKNQFDKVLSGLIEGDDELSLAAEKDPAIVTALEDVTRVWRPYADTIDSALAANEVSKATLLAISELNLPVLERMNATVGMIETNYASAGSVDPVRARTINVAGSQRTLSQQTTKAYCLIAAGIDIEANRRKLATNVKAFADTMEKLLNGAEGLEAPSDKIAAQLERVDQTWSKVEPAYNAAAAGKKPDPQTIGVLTAQANRLLSDMNRAVFYYSLME